MKKSVLIGFMFTLFATNTTFSQDERQDNHFFGCFSCFKKQPKTIAIEKIDNAPPSIEPVKKVGMTTPEAGKKKKKSTKKVKKEKTMLEEVATSEDQAESSELGSAILTRSPPIIPEVEAARRDKEKKTKKKKTQE